MAEQSPKIICELCDGAHPTTEHEVAAKEEVEKRNYHTIEGIRFEEGVPEETVRAFLDFIKQEEEQFRIHHRGNADDGCYAEYLLSGFTLIAIKKGKEIRYPILRQPLVPYGLLSGYYSVEEILKERRYGKNFRASSDYFFGENDRHVNLAISDSDEKLFLDFIRKHSGENLSEYLDYFFEPMTFDEQTGNLQLPYLEAMGFGKHPTWNKIDLPPELKHKIKVKELRDRYLTERFATPVTIDQEGWRIDTPKQYEENTL